MARSAPASPVEGTARVIAATVGSLPIALFGSVCIGRFLPLAEATRFVVGFTLAIPLWVALMCVLFLSQDAKRTWLLCVAGGLALWSLGYVLG